jgi:glycosyltransferase involved in cell wall biosynthesis
MSPPRVLAWHVHGSYLFYLAHAACELFLPVKPGRPEGYSGRSGHFAWPENVHEVAANEVGTLGLDCILLQTRSNWFEDQEEILSPAQRRLPRIYLEHDPPREHPVEQRHWVDDPGVLLVHVTPFNALMWDSGRTPTRVIEHGVVVPANVRYTGELERGIAVVNNLASRGRRVGADVFERVRARLPLDLVGMGSHELGGLGDVPIARLHALVARYRFFFNPIRYTSLGLAVCEAMMLGLPIVALATTEYATVVENGVSGFADTDVERLVERMLALLADPAEARRLGEGARALAQERFAIERFVREWEDSFALVTGKRSGEAVGATR